MIRMNSKNLAHPYPHVNRRVVITGVGAATPLGLSLEETWEALLKSKSSIQSHPDISKKQFPGAKLSPEVVSEEFHDENRMRMDNIFYTFAHFMAHQAFESSGLMRDRRWVDGHADMERKGVLISTYAYYLERMKEFPEIKKARVFTGCPFGLQGAIALEHGMLGYQGNHQNDAVGGLKCVGDAYRMIKHGYQDLFLVGGMDWSVGGSLQQLLQQEKLLEEQGQVKPMDKDAKGFVLGDGGALFILESLDRAVQRKANILAEIVGYDLNCMQGDYFQPNQEGIEIALHSVLQQADWAPEDVSYINCSARGSKQADLAEIKAIRRILGTPKSEQDEAKLRDEKDLDLSKAKNTALNGYKGAIGHLLEAEGAVELALTLKAMQENQIPGTVGLKDPIDSDLNLRPHGVHLEKPVQKAIKISLGFGDNNVALALHKNPSGHY